MIFMSTLIVINWPPTLEELFLSTSPNGFNIVLYDFLSVVFYVCFTCINHFISPSPSELADASSWIVFCRDIDRLCVCPSVRPSVCALWCSGLVLEAESCTVVFLAGHFLFTCAGTFAAGCIILWDAFFSHNTQSNTESPTFLGLLYP